jgi:DNA-binding transcriptional regulator/RsmH inhibitor MraZ
VRLFDLESWRAFDEKYIESLDEVGDLEADEQIGDLYESMYRVVPDKQGRVLLPQEFVEALGLAGKVRITGHRDHLRLWHPPTHDRHRALREGLRAAAANRPRGGEDAS